MILGIESKSPEIEFAGEIARKFDMLLSETDDESEFSNGFLIEEEKVEEIMQELYKEITCSPSTTSPPSATLPSPTSSVSSFQSSSPSFLAASDVKSESCGASVSDSASTVMVGIEFAGPTFNQVGLPEEEMRVADGGVENGVGGVGIMDGYDGEEVGDDQWLARVLAD
ncbi:hypothetical protein SLA2020_305670 [Shorea laevis]